MLKALGLPPTDKTLINRYRKALYDLAEAGYLLRSKDREGFFSLNPDLLDVGAVIVEEQPSGS